MKKGAATTFHLGMKLTTQAPILKCKTQENTVGVFFPSDGTFVQNCKLVFKKGYSIALVGVELLLNGCHYSLFSGWSISPAFCRRQHILAWSQGLARHYDYHCILDSQLLRCNKSKLSPNPKPLLPRLYKSTDTQRGLQQDDSQRDTKDDKEPLKVK